jgi:hypothetical protein
MANCNLKNMAAVDLNMEAEHGECFYSNHLNETLVNTHQVMYIYVIEIDHDEVILESIVGRNVKEVFRRANDMR